MKFNYLLLLGSISVSLLSGCNRDEDTPTPPADNGYSVPTTYNFSDANYADASTRIIMIQKMDSVTGTGTTALVDVNVLYNMFSNSGSPFLQSSLNTSGLQVEDQTLLAARTEIKRYMDSVALNSNYPVVTYVGSSTVGTAGVATASNGTSKYLLNEYGFEYRQITSKMFQGVTLFYQIKNHLSASSIGSSVDKATKIQNWDLAFGYFGVPIDFPTNLNLKYYLGSYSNQVNAINSNATIMNAFLKGRAAINNNDQATVDAQAAIILEKIEEVLAAGAIHELNAAKAGTTISDVAARSHLISEAIGFLTTLKYVGTKMAWYEADAIIGNFGTNLYNVTPQNINDTIDQISTIYGFDAVKASI